MIFNPLFISNSNPASNFSSSKFGNSVYLFSDIINVNEPSSINKVDSAVSSFSNLLMGIGKDDALAFGKVEDTALAEKVFANGYRLNKEAVYNFIENLVYNSNSITINSQKIETLNHEQAAEDVFQILNEKFNYGSPVELKIDNNTSSLALEIQNYDAVLANGIGNESVSVREESVQQTAVRLENFANNLDVINKQQIKLPFRAKVELKEIIEKLNVITDSNKKFFESQDDLTDRLEVIADQLNLDINALPAENKILINKFIEFFETSGASDNIASFNDSLSKLLVKEAEEKISFVSNTNFNTAETQWNSSVVSITAQQEFNSIKFTEILNKAGAGLATEVKDKIERIVYSRKENIANDLNELFSGLGSQQKEILTEIFNQYNLLTEKESSPEAVSFTTVSDNPENKNLRQLLSHGTVYKQAELLLNLIESNSELESSIKDKLRIIITSNTTDKTRQVEEFVKELSDLQKKNVTKLLNEFDTAQSRNDFNKNTTVLKLISDEEITSVFKNDASLISKLLPELQEFESSFKNESKISALLQNPKIVNEIKARILKLLPKTDESTKVKLTSTVVKSLLSQQGISAEDANFDKSVSPEPKTTEPKGYSVNETRMPDKENDKLPVKLIRSEFASVLKKTDKDFVTAVKDLITRINNHPAAIKHEVLNDEQLKPMLNAAIVKLKTVGQPSEEIKDLLQKFVTNARTEKSSNQKFVSTKPVLETNLPTHNKSERVVAKQSLSFEAEKLFRLVSQEEKPGKQFILKILDQKEIVDNKQSQLKDLISKQPEITSKKLNSSLTDLVRSGLNINEKNNAAQKDLPNSSLSELNTSRMEATKSINDLGTISNVFKGITADRPGTSEVVPRSANDFGTSSLKSSAHVGTSFKNIGETVEKFSANENVEKNPKLYQTEQTDQSIGTDNTKQSNLMVNKAENSEHQVNQLASVKKPSLSGSNPKLEWTDTGSLQTSEKQKLQAQVNSEAPKIVDLSQSMNREVNLSGSDVEVNTKSVVSSIKGDENFSGFNSNSGTNNSGGSFADTAKASELNNMKPGGFNELSFDKALDTEQKLRSDIAQRVEVIKDVQLQSVNSKIAAAIAGRETQALKIKLTPVSLGKVDVALEVRDNAVNAHIEVENEVVRQTVQANIEQLKQSLIQQGLQPQNLNVSLANSDDKGNRYFRNKKKNQHNTEVELENNIEKETPKNMGYNTYDFVA